MVNYTPSFLFFFLFLPTLPTILLYIPITFLLTTRLFHITHTTNPDGRFHYKDALKITCFASCVSFFELLTRTQMFSLQKMLLLAGFVIILSISLVKHPMSLPKRITLILTSTITCFVGFFLGEITGLIILGLFIWRA